MWPVVPPPSFMKRLLIPCLAGIAAISSVFSQESPKPSPASALIIFDASGSMWGQIKGKTKIEIAREVVRNLVASLPAETELGLMAYGHRQKGDCQDIELLIPVGKVDRNTFVKTVEDIMPRGMTPITASLELAAEGLGYKEQKATVILVSDGLETCNADPCAAAKKLESMGVDFTAHVIAFDLQPEETEKLRCIADSTGGRFFPASDAASLKDALDMAVGAAAATPQPKKAEDDRTAKLTAPGTAVAGSEIEVSWQIDPKDGDYITIAAEGAKDTENFGYAYTKDKTSAKITTLITPGAAEIRYFSGITPTKILGRCPIKLTEFDITMKAPAEIVAGSMVNVEWTGPGYASDYITIVPKTTKDGSYGQWNYTSRGNPLPVVAPQTVGDGEIRYMNERGNVVLARQAVKIIKGEISLKAPAEAIAGAAVPIEWTGPNNAGDFITIVPRDAKDGQYEKWEYTRQEPSLNIIATRTLGPAEIRYMNERENVVLFRTPITIVPAEITLNAAPQAAAGAEVAIEWTGPNNPGDYITIVPKDAEDGKYADYAYTKAGPKVGVSAPAEEGPAEIRYMNEDGNIVLARIGITVLPGEKKKDD